MLLLYILFYFPPPIIFPSVHITHLPLSAASISLSEKLCSLWTRYRSHFLIECAGEQSCLATLSSNPCAESWSNFLQPLESGLTRKSDVVKPCLCALMCYLLFKQLIFVYAWKRIGGRGSGFWCFVCVSVKGLQLTFLFTHPCISQPVLIRSEWCVSL